MIVILLGTDGSSEAAHENELRFAVPSCHGEDRTAKFR